MEPNQTILILGARGMVGKSLVRRLSAEGYLYLLTPSHAELDLTNQLAVRNYLQQMKPDVVIVAAAKVGGIYANMTYPAEFAYQNLAIGLNAIHESHQAGVDRLLFLGSTCIYPRNAEQPISENALLSGPLEKTNEAYAIAKIASLKLCRYYHEQYGRKYISAMPTNLYGPGDNYHPENSHVIPGLIRRLHEAKEARLGEVAMWGTGNALREFLHVDDLAAASFFLLEHYNEPEHINVGSSEEISIRNLTEMIAEVVGYSGKIVSDLSKPDGTPRKKSDTSKIQALGWKPTISLRKGLEKTYLDFLQNLS